jgi:hypothetical protein
LDPLWKGQYEIKRIQSSNAVIQELGKRMHQEVHINRLKPYFLHSLSENAATQLVGNDHTLLMVEATSGSNH